MRSRLALLGLSTLGVVVGCSSSRDRARADSVVTVVAAQGLLMDKLTAQRDSVSRLLGEADTFIGQIDSSISRVKGLPAASRAKRNSEGPLEDQVRQRKDMLRKVDALVARARQTAKEVTELKDRERALLAENGQLKDSLSATAQRLTADAEKIAQLTGTIEQQAETIAALQTRLDQFDVQLANERAAASRAYYVIGTEDELIKKGVIVKEGGANLLIKRVGRTVVPARDLNREVFTPIDTRMVHAIDVPDSSKRYQIVSRQSLDDVKVGQRDGSSFRGSIEIPDSDKFWASSKYLIIVQR